MTTTDDAYILTTTTYFRYPPFLNGNGESQPRRLASPPANCTMCGEPLIEHEFTKGFELTCDKVGCYMFRQPQRVRYKEPLEVKPKPSIPKTEQPNYQGYLEQRTWNYQRLCELGFGAVEAGRCASNKKVREIEEKIRKRGDNENQV